MTKSSFTDECNEQAAPEGSDTKNIAPETTDPSVTGTSSQEAAVITSRKNVLPDGKETESITIKLSKLPFDFADLQFSKAVFVQLSNACKRTDGFDDVLFKSMLSGMLSQKITDPHELMMVNQMAGFNDLIMKYIGHLAKAENEIEIEVYQRTLNKLARTFAGQMDLLQRYRSGGGQKVTVQNVSVSEGGQAIVGNVSQHAVDGGKGKAATKPAAIIDGHTAPMPMVEQDEQPVAVPAKRRVSQ